MPETKYSLREKKCAKTKIALARAFQERLKSMRFSDISIKEICSAVEISEGTFFNYFPNKLDLARYIQKILLLKIAWEVRQKESKLDALRMVEYVFDRMAAEMGDPFLFYEIISLYTVEKIKFKEGKALDRVEKYFAFPECDGIENVKVVSIESLLLELIIKAQEGGLVSRKIAATNILNNLMAILVGVPLTIQMEAFSNLDKLYRNQLMLLWKAVKIDKE